MSRYRLSPTPAQEAALRDLHQAWANYAAALRAWRARVARLPAGERPAPPGPPSWRNCGVHEGFRIVAAIPPTIPALANGLVVGVDRGVAVSAALSTGELLAAPALRPAEARRLRRLQRRLTRAERGSRRGQVKRAVARLRARAADRRTNWVEHTSTDLARRFDLIRIEDLDVRAMTKSAKGTVERPGKRVRQKAGLNRGILGQGWGRVVTRLVQKAQGRVEKMACVACAGGIPP